MQKTHRQKKVKLQHGKTEAIAELNNAEGNTVPVRALPDSGCGATPCLEHAAPGGKSGKVKQLEPAHSGALWAESSLLAKKSC